MTPEIAFDQHHNSLFRFVLRLTHRADVAEDITQECFLALLRAPGRIDCSRGSVTTYLFGIARNLAFSHLRDYAAEEQFDPEEHSPASTACGQLDIAASVERAIAELPPLQQEALILFQYEGFSLEEIAAICAVDTGTIKSRLHRARERLKRRLAPAARIVNSNATER